MIRRQPDNFAHANVNASREAAPRFAVSVIENDAGEILLMLRAAHLKYGPRLWGFPGGHIESGESPEHCSRRELSEELGADVRVNLVNSLGPVMDSLYGQFQIYLYHYHWLGGNITLNEEHTDFAWVTQARFADYDTMTGIDDDLRYLGIWKSS